MQIARDPIELADALRAADATGPRGLVPTMGYLHQGHLSLVGAARRECGRVCVSIFVNPAQFGEAEDFEDYPRDLDRDLALCRKEGVDLVFAPAVKDMYPEGAATTVSVGRLATILEGASRPGHFAGVCTVVAKLLHLVGPDRVYFGQKDAQQVAVVRAMVRDLNFPIEVVVLPTVREADGLALSSRNDYLSAEERAAATVIYDSLRRGAELAGSDERSADAVRRTVVAELSREPLFRLDYAEVVSAGDFMRAERLREGDSLIVVAGWIGTTRLIDNLLLAG